MSDALKVRDWSQPYKLALGVVILGFLVFVYNTGGVQLGGADSVSYITVTKATVSCVPATSTLLLATKPGRVSAILGNTGVAGVTICKSADTCTHALGFPLGVSSTAHSVYEQTDGYFGPYSCIGASTSSISVQSS